MLAELRRGWLVVSVAFALLAAASCRGGPLPTGEPALAPTPTNAPTGSSVPMQTAVPGPPTISAGAPTLVQPAVSKTLDVAISDVRDTSFVVSWLTARAEAGQVQLIGGAVYNDYRGADFAGRTHYVALTGLQAIHSYSFDVISGGARYDHNSAHWAVNTGAALAPRAPDLISGQVKNPDGSNVTEAIVYFEIERLQEGFPSAPLSTLVTGRDGGFFSVNLAESRAFSDPTRYYDYPIRGDRNMNNSVTVQVVVPSESEISTFDLNDPRLRAKGSERSLVIALSANQQETGVPTQLPPAIPSPTRPGATVSSPPLQARLPTETATPTLYRTQTPASATPLASATSTGVAAPTSGGQVQVDLNKIFPPGTGRDLVLENCLACHTFVRIVTGQRDAQGWAVVKREMRPDVRNLSDQEVDTLFAYLEANFNNTKSVPSLPDWLLQADPW